MRLDNKSTKKRKKAEVQIYVSVFENNQFQINQNQYESTKLKKNFSLYIQGSN